MTIDFELAGHVDCAGACARLACGTGVLAVAADPRSDDRGPMQAAFLAAAHLRAEASPLTPPLPHVLSLHHALRQAQGRSTEALALAGWNLRGGNEVLLFACRGATVLAGWEGTVHEVRPMSDAMDDDPTAGLERLVAMVPYLQRFWVVALDCGQLPPRGVVQQIMDAPDSLEDRVGRMLCDLRDKGFHLACLAAAEYTLQPDAGRGPEWRPAGPASLFLTRGTVPPPTSHHREQPPCPKTWTGFPVPRRSHPIGAPLTTLLVAAMLAVQWLHPGVFRHGDVFQVLDGDLVRTSATEVVRFHPRNGAYLSCQCWGGAAYALQQQDDGIVRLLRIDNTAGLHEMWRFRGLFTPTGFRMDADGVSILAYPDGSGWRVTLKGRRTPLHGHLRR